MNDIDTTIKQALAAEDNEKLTPIDAEPSVFEKLAQTMRGRNRWLSILGFIYTLIFTIAAVLCAIQFFNAETMRAMIGWAGGAIVFVHFVSMLKMWFFMEMNKNAVTREVKRLELQVARLAQTQKQA